MKSEDILRDIMAVLRPAVGDFGNYTFGEDWDRAALNWVRAREDNFNDPEEGWRTDEGKRFLARLALCGMYLAGLCVARRTDTIGALGVEALRLALESGTVFCDPIKTDDPG